jgi:SAM-dependent methyltransferase
MDRQHLADLRRKEESYWWHVNKRRIVLPLLKSYSRQAGGPLLEIGCGGGFLSSMLAEQGWQVIASDVCAEAAGYARHRGLSRVLLFDAGRRWPFESNSFRAICMLDVLEHLQHDGVALGELKRVLSPGGVAVVTVPAHPFLHSGWDRMLGHHRRYSRASLRRPIEDCGLDLVKLTYWNAVSLPAAVLLRCLRKQDENAVHKEFPEVPGWVNGLLRGYGAVESWMVRLGGIPAGLSLVGVLRKR